MKIYNIENDTLTKHKDEKFSLDNVKLFRVIRNVFWSISSYLFTSIASLKKIHLSEEEKTKHDALETQDPYLHGFINILKNNQELGDLSLQSYYDNYLKKEHNNLKADFSYLTSYQVQNQKEEQDQNYIYIPFSIEKSHSKIFKLFAKIFRLPVRDHYSHILIDKKNKIVEYYDPKGFLDTDRVNSHIKKTHQKISNCVNEIIKKYSLNGYTLYKHTYQNQIDSYNCGVYGLHYLEKCLKNGSEKLLKNQRAAKLPFCKVKDFREKIIKNLLTENKKESTNNITSNDIDNYLKEFNF